MAMAQVISTHHLFKQLKEVGFEEKQAEQVINTIETLQDARLEGVASKEDMLLLKNDLKSEIAGVKSDINLLKWGIALIIVVNVVPILTDLFVI